MKKLSEIKIGDTFAGADGVERILLDFLPDGTALTLTRDFVFVNEKFDENSNNYAKSHIRNRLETEELPKLEKTFGKENIVEFEVDLTSCNFSILYGAVKTKYSLLSIWKYRKYRELISKYEVNGYWWLATAEYISKTPTNKWVCCVFDTEIDSYVSGYQFGVRAVCRLKTNILVKEIKKW